MKKGWLKNLMAKLFKGSNILLDNAEEAVKVLEVVKRAINNPAVGILVGITRNKVDDAVLKSLKAYVPFALDAVGCVVAIDTCRKKDTEDERIECYLQQVAKLSKLYKDGFYHHLAIGLMESRLKDYGVEIHKEDLAKIIEGTYQAYKREQVFMEPNK